MFPSYIFVLTFLFLPFEWNVLGAQDEAQLNKNKEYNHQKLTKNKNNLVNIGQPMKNIQSLKNKTIYRVSNENLNIKSKEPVKTRTANDVQSSKEATYYIPPKVSGNQGKYFKEDAKSSKEATYYIPPKDSGNQVFKEDAKSSKEATYYIPPKDSGNQVFKEDAKSSKEATYYIPPKDSGNQVFKEDAKSSKEATYYIPPKDSGNQGKDFKEDAKSSKEATYYIPPKDSGNQGKDFKKDAKSSKEATYYIPPKDLPGQEQDSKEDVNSNKESSYYIPPRVLNDLANKGGMNPGYHKEIEELKDLASEQISYTQENVAANWPLGIIPYYFNNSCFDDVLRKRVEIAMDYLQRVSCIRFQSVMMPNDMNHTWIHITNPEKERECVHGVKAIKSGEVVLVLGFECLSFRQLLHSLLHAIGFRDEVTHPHRDQYIRIMWENIQPKYRHLFRSALEDRQPLVEYDPQSIMQFHDRAFSLNGGPTIMPLMTGLRIQPADYLSQLDEMKLRLAFGRECNRRTVNNLVDTCQTALHEDENGGDQNDESEREPEGLSNSNKRGVVVDAVSSESDEKIINRRSKMNESKSKTEVLTEKTTPILIKETKQRSEITQPAQTKAQTENAEPFTEMVRMRGDKDPVGENRKRFYIIKDPSEEEEDE